MADNGRPRAQRKGRLGGAPLLTAGRRGFPGFIPYSLEHSTSNRRRFPATRISLSGSLWLFLTKPYERHAKGPSELDQANIVADTLSIFRRQPSQPFSYRFASRSGGVEIRRQLRERAIEDHFRQSTKLITTRCSGIATIEKRTDMYISTLRSHIEAMGGKLEVVARFPEGTVGISNISEPGGKDGA